MSYQDLFVRRNNALISKILDIDRKRSAGSWVSSDLGVLGRRFKSYLPDSKNPSY